MSWEIVEERSDGYAYMNKPLGLFVIASNAIEDDGNAWIHVSVSRRSRMPSYDDLKLVKNKFIGEDKHAYQCFVPTSEHINIHSYCLHLWAREDGKAALPDFSHGTGSI